MKKREEKQVAELVELSVEEQAAVSGGGGRPIFQPEPSPWIVVGTNQSTSPTPWVLQASGGSPQPW